jgi:hypothetical protein
LVIALTTLSTFVKESLQGLCDYFA